MAGRVLTLPSTILLVIVGVASLIRPIALAAVRVRAKIGEVQEPVRRTARLTQPKQTTMLYAPLLCRTVGCATTLSTGTVNAIVDAVFLTKPRTAPVQIEPHAASAMMQVLVLLRL